MPGKQRETQQDIRIGDVLLNHYAGEINPGRKTIIVSISPSLVTCISTYKGKIHKCQYYQRDVRWDEKFEIVGHIDVLGMIRNALDDTLFRP